MIHKSNIDQLDFIKIKNYNSTKHLVIRMKRHTTDWRKVFARHISNKELVFRIYKELSKLKK